MDVRISFSLMLLLAFCIDTADLTFTNTTITEVVNCPEECEKCIIQDDLDRYHLYLVCTSVPPPTSLPSGFTSAVIEFNYMTFETLPSLYFDEVASKELDLIFNYCHIKHFSKHVINRGDHLNLTLTFNSGEVNVMERSTLVVNSLNVLFFEVTIGTIEPGTFTATNIIERFEFKHVDVDTIYSNSIVSKTIKEITFIFSHFKSFHQQAFHADVIDLFKFEFSSILSILHHVKFSAKLHIYELITNHGIIHSGNLFAGIERLDFLQMNNTFIPQLCQGVLPVQSNFLNNTDSGIFHSGFRGICEDFVSDIFGPINIPDEHFCDLHTICDENVHWMFGPTPLDKSENYVGEPAIGSPMRKDLVDIPFFQNLICMKSDTEEDEQTKKILHTCNLHQGELIHCDVISPGEKKFCKGDHQMEVNNMKRSSRKKSKPSKYKGNRNNDCNFITSSQSVTVILLVLSLIV